jgi:hypothetical protein
MSDDTSTPYIVRTLSEALLVACVHLRSGVQNRVKNIEKCLVNMKATPNERRMMHHRKKRIRRKYYNRVKRRVYR